MGMRLKPVFLFINRFLFKALILFSVLIATLIVYANVVEIPHPIINRVLVTVSRGSFAIVAESARLRGLRTIRLYDASVYRKRVLGKPFLEASVVDIQINIAGWLRGAMPVAAIVAEDAEWRPEKGKSDAQRRKPHSIERRMNYRAEVRNCRLYDITLDRFSCHVLGEDKNVTAQDIDVELSGEGKSGRLTGTVGVDLLSRTMSGSVVSQLDPIVAKSFYVVNDMPFVKKLVDRFDFDGDPPRGEWRFEKQLSTNQDFHVTGDFRMRDCRYRGVDLLRADGSITVDRKGTNTVAEVNNLFLVRREGMANVAFTVSPRKSLVEFEAESSLRPLAMARMVGVLTNLLTRSIVFNGSSSLLANGKVDYSPDHSATDVRGSVQADNVMVREFPVNSGACDINVRGQSVTITNIAAHSMDGRLTGTTSLLIQQGGSSNVPFNVDMNFKDVNFERFMQVVARESDKREYRGRLSGAIRLSGQTGNMLQQSMNGEGNLRISDGRVFMLPIFGGLSRLMTKIIPGLDFVLRQSDANSKFTIKEGLVTTDKVAIEGDILSLSGKGSYVLGGDLDFDVQLKLFKEHTLVARLVRTLTFPISKLFEFRLKGPLSDPQWYPVNFSFDLLERIGLRKPASEKGEQPEVEQKEPMQTQDSEPKVLE